MTDKDKVVVPIYVANWYEKHKDNLDHFMFMTTTKVWNADLFDDLSVFEKWFYHTTGRYEILLSMRDGYIIDDKRYNIIIGSTILVMNPREGVPFDMIPEGSKSEFDSHKYELTKDDIMSLGEDLFLLATPVYEEDESDG